MPISPSKEHEHQTNKVHKLMTSPSIVRLERIIESIDNVVLNLTPQYKEFYDKHFVYRNNKVRVCMDMYIEERTFYNYKNKIIRDLAQELGYL